MTQVKNKIIYCALKITVKKTKSERVRKIESFEKCQLIFHEHM